MDHKQVGGLTPDQIELKGFNRTLAEIEWLLLILILVYLVVPDAAVTDPVGVISACAAFTVFVIVFRYLNLFRVEARWKLTIETWAMILLTAFVVWHTGKVDSPLINLYLLVIVFSALTLGRAITLLEIALIASFYLHAGFGSLGEDLFTYRTFSEVMINFAPFVLVAYVTSLLAADMNFARSFAQRLSETDELTGALNMRAFLVALGEQQIAAQRDDSHFAVMMVDADNLKQVNDRLGHEIGNELIRSLVEGIRRGLRSTDIIARYGGDEFVALLPETREAAAREAAERVRRSIENTAFDFEGERISTTVSVGYAIYPEDATDLQDLLARADRALYASKDSGRNQVSGHAELEAPSSGRAAAEEG